MTHAETEDMQKFSSASFPAALTSLYAVLLGIVTARHEMFRDEMQAWLIARDSNSLADLVHNLRYEGHPVLWYLFLFLPSHISWNPVSMQVINWAFAVGEAYLIASVKQLSKVTRTLLVSSFFLFYGYGATARNYMLAALLLTGAALCLLAERKRPWLAIVLLALAINTHFFAVPVALALFFGFYWFRPEERWKDGWKRLHEGRFWIASAVLLVSLAIAYVTLRPPADRATPQYGSGQPSIASELLLSQGRTWQIFVPVPEIYLPVQYRELFVPRFHPSVLASVVSLLMVLVIAAALRHNRARYFFLGLAILETAIFAFTVHIPSPRHYGLIFVVLMIALLIDAFLGEPNGVRWWLPRRIAGMVMCAVLGIQVVASVSASAADVLYPFSEGKLASEWIRQHGYTKYPLVLQPDANGTSVLGYLERDKAYYPACRCFSSFILYRSDWEHSRQVTKPELDALAKASQMPVVVVTSTEFSAAAARDMKLQLLRNSTGRLVFLPERFFIYLHPVP